LEGQDEFDAAEQLLEEAVAASRRVLGDEHCKTLTAIKNLAQVRLRRGAS
jgi:Tetratricopeptide repeat